MPGGFPLFEARSSVPGGVPLFEARSSVPGDFPSFGERSSVPGDFPSFGAGSSSVWSAGHGVEEGAVGTGDEWIAGPGDEMTASCASGGSLGLPGHCLGTTEGRRPAMIAALGRTTAKVPVLWYCASRNWTQVDPAPWNQTQLDPALQNWTQLDPALWNWTQLDHELQKWR